MKKVFCFLILGVFVWALTHVVVQTDEASAAGFGIYEWSSRGNAMGGALMASPNPDASTVAYNPAAMTQLEGMHTLAGTTFIAPSAKVDYNGRTESTVDHVFVIPHAYATAELGYGFWVGFGSYTRFGLGTSYDKEWAGRRNIEDVIIETASFNPNIAYKINDVFSIAAGVEFMSAKGRYQAWNNNLGDIGTRTHGMAIGWNVAVYAKITEQWAAGFTYRASTYQQTHGHAELHGGALNQNEDTEVKLGMRLPASWSVGVSYEPIETLRFEVDLVYTVWSQYEKFTMEFGPNSRFLSYSESIKDWQDTIRIQFGVEYDVLDWLTLRAGYVFDESPQDKFKDFLVPAQDRHLISTGVGMAYGDFDFDLAYVFLFSEDFHIDHVAGIGGEADIHDCITHIGSLSVAYEF